MRLAVSILAVVFLLAPASAVAHTEFRNVTLDGPGWSNTHVTGQGATGLDCGQWTWVNPQTGPVERYVYNINDPGHAHFGIAEDLGGGHIHPPFEHYATGPETHFFNFPQSSGGYLEQMGSRRVWILSPWGWLKAVRFVAMVSNTTKYIRANCPTPDPFPG